MQQDGFQGGDYLYSNSSTRGQEAVPVEALLHVGGRGESKGNDQLTTGHRQGKTIHED
jgi:hypothetical protein